MKNFLGLFIGVQSRLSFALTLLLRGRFVGKDMAGNSYYRGKKSVHTGREKRWVTYASGDPEASQVPPEYHGWLHHQTDVFPDADKESYRRPWQLPHQPNLTGTTLAYRPDGHLLRGGQRQKATGDYEVWIPE